MARKKVKNIYLRSKWFKEHCKEPFNMSCEDLLSARENFICWLLDEVDGHNNGFRSCIIKGHYNEYQDDEYYPLE